MNGSWEYCPWDGGKLLLKKWSFFWFKSAFQKFKSHISPSPAWKHLQLCPTYPVFCTLTVHTWKWNIIFKCRNEEWRQDV
jgi:hypothetical protein